MAELTLYIHLFRGCLDPYSCPLKQLNLHCFLSQTNKYKKIMYSFFYINKSHQIIHEQCYYAALWGNLISTWCCYKVSYMLVFSRWITFFFNSVFWAVQAAILNNTINHQLITYTFITRIHTHIYAHREQRKNYIQYISSTR